MTKIELTPTEASVLKLCAERKFEPDDASEIEQDAYISLIDKASTFEEENGLLDERLDYTYDCNLLVWFYKKYSEQSNV